MREKTFTKSEASGKGFIQKHHSMFCRLVNGLMKYKQIIERIPILKIIAF